MPEDRPFEHHPIPLNGRLRTAIDGTELGEGDFQTLKNMRYGEISPKSITGMTKINSSVINATYLKPRSGFHFRKAQPAESHVLVQSWNTGLTAGLVYENTTAIPSAGNFTATAIWTDTASSGIGRFSNAPDGCVAYCNEKDSCIWGGSEYRCGAFLVGDLVETTLKDYTGKINNTLQDANNIATLTTVDTSIDASTELLLHLDNNLTDSSSNALTVTHANLTYSSSIYRFATHSAVFNGTSAYITTADDPVFDFSGGTWSIDFWIYPDSSGSTSSLYHQGTDSSNYFNIDLNKSGTTFTPRLGIVAAGASVVSMTGSSTLANNAWNHLMFVEQGNYWYCFLNGTLIGLAIDTSRAADYGGAVYIGCDNITGSTQNYFKGYIDEFRVSSTNRYMASFSAPPEEYGLANNTCYLYVGSTRPIKGAKFYVKTANASASSVSVCYWGENWLPVTTLADGTSAGGITLSTTGSITFDTTVNLATPRSLNRIFLYWYLFTFSGIDTGTQIYYATLDAPMQQIVDLWDGIPRTIGAYYRYSTSYIDEATNVLEEDYDSTDATTYSALGTTDQFFVGFTERMAGLEFKIGSYNSLPTMMSIYYWDGDSWALIDSVKDGTASGAVSFGRSGIATWDAPTEASEFMNSISSSDLLYFYKIDFSHDLSATVRLDYITGITAGKSIHGYAYPVMWQNSLWLLNEVAGRKNSAIATLPNTICVFNGENAITPDAPMLFGNEEGLTCGATLFSRFAGDIYENLVLFKKTETWLIDGTEPSNYRKYKISDNYGCVAPGTLKSCDTGIEIAPGIMKHVLIWQSENAIVMFDGISVQPISDDIKNYFDKTKTECIPSSMLYKSESFYDESLLEYHWLFASGSSATTLNKELVFSLKKKGWFEIDRGTGKYLQIGFSVRDTNGSLYTYGGIDTGYIERLEYGTTFDGGDIISQWRNGDIALGGWGYETKVRIVKHIAIVKSTTTNSVTMTHYGDCISSSSQTHAFTVNSTTKRVIVDTASIDWGNNIFHSFNCSLTTNNENCGYEPIGILVMYPPIRESRK